MLFFATISSNMFFFFRCFTHPGLDTSSSSSSSGVRTHLVFRHIKCYEGAHARWFPIALALLLIVILLPILAATACTEKLRKLIVSIAKSKPGVQTGMIISADWYD